jgi:60 kDa SS-A/Ro ribonucleoprotein
MSHKYLSKAAAAVANPPQSQPLDERQVLNNAGGFVYAVDDWKRLDRFLILGSSGGTYYVGESKLTADNIDCLKRVVVEDGIRVVMRIVEISDSGRAPKNDPALFALAYCASKGNLETRRLALLSLPKVARIGTHLYHFITFAKQFRGMGRGLRSAITEWYASKTPEQFAQQATKYQSRDGWSHRDLLRLVRPKFSGQHQLIARWVVKGELEAENAAEIPRALIGHVAVQKATTPKEAAELIREFGVVRESIPTQLLNSKEVWEALLEKMPLTALLRNLGNMSKVGLLIPMSDASKFVAKQLSNAEALRKSRVHPLAVLLASSVYGAGHGFKGSGNWTVDPKIFEALNEAFYGAFENVEPTGKRFYLGIDVSGSMSSGSIAGSFLTPRAGACAMALVTARTEENYYLAGFQDRMIQLPFTSKTTLDSAIKHTDGLSFGSTDCAQPMLDALAKGIKADVFVVITDNESWVGDTHPMKALQNYRNKTGINAKLVVMAMTANDFSIADPKDGGTLDICGFDASTPSVLADFARE